MMTLVKFSVARPRSVLLVTFLITLLALLQFPKIATDTNPKNMLPATSEVRKWNRSIEKTFALYEDMIVVGIRNDGGVLNRAILGKVPQLTARILGLDGVAEQDVTSLSTITNVDADGDTLRVGPLMPRSPTTEADVDTVRHALDENPLFKHRIVSEDHKTTAIYVPLLPKANGKRIADQIRDYVAHNHGTERYYIAGDPVVRDTFGVEMFRVMGLFAPIAGMIMMALAYLMFKRLTVAFTVMLTAMVITIWSMGAVIGAGYPIHIMTSMAPVFLMAIATDAIHIFNEYFYRLVETRDKKTAILETMQATRLPLLYTDLTTAFAFGSLAFAGIIPLKVFGICVALGTLLLLLLSFTFVPAVMTTLNASHVRERGPVGVPASRLLRSLAALGARRPAVVLGTGAALLAVSVWGITKLTVNNNQVNWFRPGSEIRIADSVLNDALGGTATANIVLSGPDEGAFKTAQGLLFADQVERALLTIPEAGAALGLSDYVKRINQVIHGGAPGEFRVPEDSNAIAQYIFLFSTASRSSDIANVADPDFKSANILLQLKTWDVSAMRKVVQVIDNQNLRAPPGYTVRPAGTAYFGLVWNDEVLWDMLKGFVFGLIAVFLILALNFRSFKWAFISYVPLAMTIVFIYGIIGFVGKDFDMPIAVLSCLSLGMAVDFAIHFVGRFRQRLASMESENATEATEQYSSRNLADALLWTATRPGRGILRNAALFAAAFSVMLFAPLTPYITVGAFMVAMMFLSALLTILVLPSLIIALRRWLFGSVVIKQLSVPQGAGV